MQLDSITSAIYAATITAVSALGVAIYNGYRNRQIEASKDEAARILEMIRTGDVRTAAKNLKFLLEAGLIDDPERRQKIQLYLDKNPEEIPVLPTASHGYVIESSDALSEETKTSLERSLDAYAEYLAELGFARPPLDVSIRVEAPEKMMDGWLSYYNSETHSIVVDSTVVADADLPRRDYTHPILWGYLQGWSQEIELLESDVADYFVCSFSNRPWFGAIVARVKGYEQPFLRNLNSRAPFAKAQPAKQALLDVLEVWGGMLWEVRSALGKNADGKAKADSIVAQAWMRMPPLAENADPAASFIVCLLDAAGAENVGVVRNALRERGFPVPEN